MSYIGDVGVTNLGEGFSKLQNLTTFNLNLELKIF
jgi:hypothetical protein